MSWNHQNVSSFEGDHVRLKRLPCIPEPFASLIHQQTPPANAMGTPLIRCWMATPLAQGQTFSRLKMHPKTTHPTHPRLPYPLDKHTGCQMFMKHTWVRTSLVRSNIHTTHHKAKIDPFPHQFGLVKIIGESESAQQVIYLMLVVCLPNCLHVSNVINPYKRI